MKQIKTTRFGTVEIDDSLALTFPDGMRGARGRSRFTVLEPEDDGVFYWLQSLDDPASAFVITDPKLFIPNYRVPITPKTLQMLGPPAQRSDVQAFVFVDRSGKELTINLQCPLLINTETKVGVQVIRPSRRWPSRWKVVDLKQTAAGATP